MEGERSRTVRGCLGSLPATDVDILCAEAGRDSLCLKPSG